MSRRARLENYELRFEKVNGDIRNLKFVIRAYVIRFMIVARKFIISGLVQGVGFRFFTQRAAARHQIRGYVTNLADGRVETLAEGDERAVENFKHDLIAGPDR